MNISKTTGVGENLGIDYPHKKATSNKPLLGTPISNGLHNDDIVSISNEAKTIFAAEQNLMLVNEHSSALAEMLRQLEESPSDSKNPFDDKLKCLLIAARMINGDNVPSKDRKFLAEKEPGMYSNALLLRRKNDKPKKYKSLLEDEEDDSTINLKLSNVPGQSDSDGPTSDGAVSSDGVEVSIDLEA